MKIKYVSEGSNPPKNEDVVAFHIHDENAVDLWIMDGASSVADRDYIDFERGDPVWFVQNLNRLLKDAITLDQSPESIIYQAISSLKEAFEKQPGSIEMPVYARPIAAITWIRVIRKGNNKLSLHIYALGDCKAFVSQNGIVSDIDPYVNPQEVILSKIIAQWQAEGGTDKDKIKEKLLPVLRDRRELQNTTTNADVLSLNLNGKFNGRKYIHEITGGSIIFIMTDGFYRLVDTYALYSVEGLIKAYTNKGLETLLRELRDFEMQHNSLPQPVIKKSDDASALSCVF